MTNDEFRMTKEIRNSKAESSLHIPKLSASERGVYAASLSLLPQLALNSNLVGSFTLKRPEGRAPTNRQLMMRMRG